MSEQHQRELSALALEKEVIKAPLMNQIRDLEKRANSWLDEKSALLTRLQTAELNAAKALKDLKSKPK